MNHILQQFARSWLVEHLAQCTQPQRDLFVRMYGHWMGPVVTIDKVVNAMHVDKLDLAMEQVERTLNKSRAATQPEVKTK